MGIASIIGTIVIIMAVAMALLFGSVYFFKKYAKKKCPEGPSFWCANKANWALCMDHTKEHSYDNYCCKDNTTWMGRSGRKDPDPNTNGFDENCM